MSDKRSRDSIGRILVTSSTGAMLEYYDFFVYAALTGTLTELFLPAQDKAVATLLAAATFGVSYLARPLGTVIFSPMADRIGRKKTFVVTLALMGVATVSIGCLPTYAAIGVWAPAMLLFLRVVQGVGLGGEYGSAVVYVTEHAPAERRGRYTSVLQGTATVGLLIALVLVSLLKATLTADAFMSWGWRVPFLISAPIVMVATLIRLRMRETPVFTALQVSGQVSKSPLLDTVRTWKSWKSILLATFGAQGATSVTLYTSIVYMLYFLQTVLKVDQSHTNMCLAVAIIVAAPCYPLFGALSDRIGRSRVMLAGIVLWMVAVYPAFSAIRGAVQSSSWAAVTAVIAVLAVLTAMVMAPLPAFITEQFPPQTRTTGFGFAQQLGNILFGGFLPLISLSLVDFTGNQLAGVGYSVASLVPCLAVTLCWGLRSERSRRNEVAAAAQPLLVRPTQPQTL
ncbi:MHS family MFS transporter [Mycobacterium sp. 21AC1]|uniref:MFS transporter n=1 Tax=[Mycobacterium] appelbergii TaxID=2939269 RepID=UPI002938D6AA|nr:MFS transporter [Mycobacterium sp. 21AC1]MDV3127298.1 MHS family MFS transporter [Mycobacterium sp. 21AC1]